MSANPPSIAPLLKSPGKTIAPVWHTAIVLLLLIGLASIAVLGGGASRAQHRMIGYVLTMAAEWLIVGFIALGARFQGATLATIAGEFSPSWRSVGRDLIIAVVYLLVAQAVLGATSWVVGHFLRSASPSVFKNLLPHTLAEDIVYVLLALTAGICEEMIFRGYLQRQFTAWTRNAAAGIVAQAVLFGAAHMYQGAGSTVVIAVYGCMFGWLAWWRKSLRPGMTAHFLQDAVGGLILAKFLK